MKVDNFSLTRPAELGDVRRRGLPVLLPGNGLHSHPVTEFVLVRRPRSSVCAFNVAGGVGPGVVAKEVRPDLLG